MVEMPILTCLKCGWRWYPRKPDVVVCPKCHSPYWNKAKTDSRPPPIPTSDNKA